jgi:hypothetical protein
VFVFQLFKEFDMKIVVNAVVDPKVFDCANPKPGIYRSEKGSILMKPENNVTNRGNVGTQSDHVWIHDIDTGKDIIKLCSDVKGKYTFLCGLDAVTMSIGACDCAAVANW